jgi:hypothetical protein
MCKCNKDNEKLRRLFRSILTAYYSDGGYSKEDAVNALLSLWFLTHDEIEVIDD